MKGVCFLTSTWFLVLMTACGGRGSVSTIGTGASGGPGGNTGGTNTTASPGCDDPINWGGNTQGSPSGLGSAFSPTGSMKQPRAGHTATLLANGNVLIIDGGQLDIDDLLVSIPSAELFDPAQKQFSTVGRPCVAREFHTSTLLKNGKVLVAGGNQFSGYPAWLPATPTAELYDPANGSFTTAGTMQTGRTQHTATLLADGQVLIVGGSTSVDALSSTEIYNPDAGVFTAGASMASPRTAHTATTLLSGKVLIAGGENAQGALSSAELYDPATNKFSTTGSMVAARVGHTATLLANGKVLIAGGVSSSIASTGILLPGTTQLSSAELYDPNTGIFSSTGTMADGRIAHTATLLSNGY